MNAFCWSHWPHSKHLQEISYTIKQPTMTSGMGIKIQKPCTVVVFSRWPNLDYGTRRTVFWQILGITICAYYNWQTERESHNVSWNDDEPVILSWGLAVVISKRWCICDLILRSRRRQWSANDGESVTLSSGLAVVISKRWWFCDFILRSSHRQCVIGKQCLAVVISKRWCICDLVLGSRRRDQQTVMNLWPYLEV